MQIYTFCSSEIVKKIIKQRMETLLPPELWEQIFHLLNFKDCQNAYNTCTLWRDILESSKSSWMFGQALPLFLEYLSKSDVFQCRKVCKYWLDGVDHFLENNGYHRPAFEVDNPTNYKYLCGLPSHTSYTILHKKNMAYHSSNGPIQKERLLLEATTHPRCPLVGRAVCILESATIQSRALNTEFLQHFGNHIWFLRLVIRDEPPKETLQRLLTILGFVPNLKKLDIQSKTQAHCLGAPGDTEVVTEVMQNFVRNELSEEHKRAMPKLETFRFDVTGFCGPQLVEAIVSVLHTVKLQTLGMSLTPNLEHFQVQNIVNLSLAIGSEEDVLQLLRLTCPVRTLALNVSGRIYANILRRSAKHFHKTLQNFEVKLSPDFYDENDEISPEELCAQLEPFTNRGLLHGTSLKSFTLVGCRPLSLNFLLGVSPKLEYLTVALENMKHWGKFLKIMGMMIKFKEEMDLLEILQRRPPRANGIMYRSNVWKLFPRLKVLTVHYEVKRSIEKVEYRRDVYEKS